MSRVSSEYMTPMIIIMDMSATALMRDMTSMIIVRDMSATALYMTPVIIVRDICHVE